MMPDLKIPDLDAMEEDELRELAAQLRLIARYALQRAGVMAFRRKGDIWYAQIAEQKLDEIYESIPHEWRW